jgi:SWI/SNF-related matrix-associated actin-dependent regulator of chromatin subfamily A member 5
MPFHTQQTANVLQLWALLHFLLPDVFTLATAVKFEEGFDLLRGVCDPTRLRQARQLLTLLMLRRVKDQVDIPLPSKTELTLLVKLTPIQRAFYKHLLVSQVGIANSY